MAATIRSTKIAEHVRGGVGVEPRLRQRHDAVDDGEDAGEPEHRRREEEPAEAGLVVLVASARQWISS
jgi:hypothetical protein